MEHCGLKAWHFALRRRHWGRHSEILEYESSREGLARVVVKRIPDGVQSKEAETALGREFEALETIRRQLPVELLDTVPRPLMVTSGSRALVLEGLPGRPLSGVLKRHANRLVGATRRAHMLTIGQRTGSWLRQFHQATSTEQFLHDSAHFREICESRLARCHTIGVPTDQIDAVRRVLGQASDRMEGHPLPAAARQGDFIPQNILLDADRVRVVDFENFCEIDAVYQDVATFLSYVQALGEYSHYSQRALRKLSEGFLQAYEVSGNEFPLKLYLIRSIVWLISEIHPARPFLFRRKQLRVLVTQLQHACAELLYE